MTYKYVSPAEKGYDKIKVSVKKHNELFPSRRKSVFCNIEYYYNPTLNHLIIQYFVKSWFKPIAVLISYLPHAYAEGFPDANREVSRLFHERERGHFVEDRFAVGYGEHPKLEKFLVGEVLKHC